MRIARACTVLLLSMLLTAAALRPAVAQTDEAPPPHTAESATPLEPWPADTELFDYSEEHADFVFTMPGGGALLSEQEAGIIAGSDPMAYPVIWVNEQAPVVHHLIMLGVYELDHELTADEFARISADEDRNHSGVYPLLVDSNLEIHAGELVWRMYTRRSADESVEMMRLSTWRGPRYYSFLFHSNAGIEPELAWAQVSAILGSFGPFEQTAADDSDAEDSH